MSDFDDLVIGAGMAGLAVAALLAESGRRVLVVEAHDVPGGYAHTFTMKRFRFCAQVHYIFGCGEGETIDRLLRRIGVSVPFVRLDSEGFDHVVVAGERVRIPNGLAKFRERLLRLYPQWRAPILGYFEAVMAVGEQLDRSDELPKELGPLSVLRSAYRFRHLLRYMRSTLEDVYDALDMPPRLRAILAGQSGDYLLPPRDVSFILHVALVCGYDRGAYYPRDHFASLVDAIADSIRARPGCAILLEHEVERIHSDGRRVLGVTTKNGRRFTASRYVSNVDPQLTARLVGEPNLEPDAKRLRYEYSCSTVTLYLAVQGLDLRDHGFGSFNVWHYPHEDINRMYDDQLRRHDLSDPWLFMSTPTLHSDAPGLCPPGHQVLEVATCADHAYFAELRSRDRRAYNVEKKKIRERILDVIEANYVPRLRDHLAIRVLGTPATNERFCRAPAGNAYGAALVPSQVALGRRPYRTSLENLWMANATAGLPSVAGAIGAGMKVFEEMTAALVR
ncbi:MAG: phytoene desaturase family protein [Polyangiales bacterium]